MKLLIVDDEPIALEGLTHTVNFQDYGVDKVFTARSMARAQEILKKWQIDIALCDIEMPGGSGLDLIAWIRENYPDMVNIILSCHSEFDFARQALDLSCLQYLVKPASSGELGAALTKAVQLIEKRNREKTYQKLGREYAVKVSGVEREDQDALGKVEEYIRSHIDEEMTVEQLASMVFISANYLTRCFKKKHGKPVSEYIIELRMTLAQEMLKNTDLTVTAISSKVGYPNYTYFTKLFKKYSGDTPTEYRGRHKGAKKF